MKHWIFFLLFSFTLWGGYSQTYEVKGRVVTLGGVPIEGASIEAVAADALSSSQGEFVLQLPVGQHALMVQAEGYLPYRTKITVDKELLILPEFALELDASSQVITISEQELDEDDSSVEGASNFLQATRETYFQRASFDFSQIFYKPRGYDAKESSVLLNGIPMAKAETGRALWSNWGGLNDFTRQQEIVVGLAPSQFDFGGVFGSTAIKARPSEIRRGTRLTATASNRTYVGRLMATHNSGINSKGFGYVVSASGRWTDKHTTVEGTLQNSYSIAGALEYKANSYFAVNLLGMYAYNHRGKNAPLTSEAIALGKRHYNPNWGYQNGKLRNAKMKRVSEPIFILSQYYNRDKFQLNTNFSYQFGEVGDTRVQYSKGQNPAPTYYTNLPSYFYGMYDPTDPNTDIYAFDKTARQIEFFKNNKQLNWEAIYKANYNGDGESLYSLNEDIISTQTFTANALSTYNWNKYLTLNAGLTYQYALAKNYQQINDLLGGSFLLNKSYFSGENYDNDTFVLKEGDIYQYYYGTISRKLNGFVQSKVKYRKLDAYAALRYLYADYQREGYFSNNSIYTDAKGFSELKKYHTLSAKLGGYYRITGRHIVELNTGYLQVPQSLNASFVNIRQSNKQIPVKAEEQFTADASYILRLPFVKARLTGYFTNFDNVVEKSNFFTEARVGTESSAFISQSAVGIQKQHYGMELGAESQITPKWKVMGVLSLNKYQYKNKPLLYTSSDAELLSNPKEAYLNGYYVGAGPQQVASLAVEYRSVKYWWAGISGSFFNHNYVSIAPSLRTSNIYIDPATGELFKNINTASVQKMLHQEDLGQAFLVNLNAGKSWRIRGKYLLALLNVNNVLNNFFKSGGFEQARKGNYQDMLREGNGYPVFGNKYFVGQGTTFMLNVMYNL